MTFATTYEQEAAVPHPPATVPVTPPEVHLT